MKSFPILNTEKLILRQLADGDAVEVFALRSDAQINKYLDRQPCHTLEDAIKFIGKIKSNNQPYWAITQKGNEKLVGTISLFNLIEEQRTCEIGYELLTEFQGKGIMRAAATTVIDYAIHTLGLKTVDAYTHKDNQSSANLLRKLDFKCISSVEQQNADLILFRLNSRKIDQ